MVQHLPDAGATNHGDDGRATKQSVDSVAPLGANLEPLLQKVCDDRLSQIRWFRTSWQRGGASTGYASFRDDDGIDREVVVKLPVPPIERFWLTTLGPLRDVCPFVYAHGTELAGYDMAWVVMERLHHGPLDTAWAGRQFDLLIEAVGRFYAASAQIEPAPSTETSDWPAILHRSRQSVEQNGLADSKRWNRALRQAQRKLKEWLPTWNDRRQDQWCHGDLHLANAMTRQPAPAGPALLLDYAMARCGHWVEDGVYLEHLYWASKETLGERKLCRQIGQTRKKLGLPVEKDWVHLAQVRRAMLAMSVPALLDLYARSQVEAALGVLETIGGS